MADSCDFEIKDKMIDINHIHARHDAIHPRLENWARWARVSPKRWASQPMFRLYQSKARHWEIDPTIRIEINTLDASEIERAVYHLPEKHRYLIRWFYVFSHIPINKVLRETGLTRDAAAKALDDSRDMLRNRLKEKIVDVG